MVNYLLHMHQHIALSPGSPLCVGCLVLIFFMVTESHFQIVHRRERQYLYNMYYYNRSCTLPVVCEFVVRGDSVDCRTNLACMQCYQATF